MWGVKFSVKETSNFSADAERTSSKVAEIAAKDGKAVYYHSGIVGTNYFIAAMPIDNSKNEAIYDGSAYWLNGSQNTVSGYQVTGITNDSLGYSFKKFKYLGTLSSSAYNKITWTANDLKVKGNTTKTYAIAASSPTNKTVTGDMILGWIKSDETKFQLINYTDFFADSAYSDFLAIARVSENGSTNQKAIVIDYEGDDFSISSSMISAFAIEAGHINVGTLSAISANIGTATAGTLIGTTIQTSSSTAKVQLDSSGIRAWAGSGLQTVHINIDGTGWLGASDKLSWDAVGNLTVTGVVADSVAAEDIVAGTITGSTLQTASSGTRFIVSTTDNQAQFYYDSGSGIQKVCKIGIDNPGFDAVIEIKNFTTTDLPQQAIYAQCDSDGYSTIEAANFGNGGALLAYNTGAGAAIVASSLVGTGYGIRAIGNSTRPPLHLDGLGGAPSAGSNGDIYYDSTANKFYGFAGGAWVAFH